MGDACESCPNGSLHQEVRELREANIRTTTVLEHIEQHLAKLTEIGETQIRLEERQIEQGRAIDRAFGAIEQVDKNSTDAIGKLGDRVSALEKKEPVNSLTSNWIISGVTALIAGVIGWAAAHIKG